MAWLILLNILGFASDFLQVTEKWVTCPCDLQTPSPLSGSSNLQSQRQDSMQCIRTKQRRRANPLPQRLLCSLISFTHSSAHYSKIYSLMPTYCATTCAWHWKSRERVITTGQGCVETRTKTDERVWWRKPRFGGFSWLHCIAGSHCQSELHPPSVQWLVRGRHENGCRQPGGRPQRRPGRGWTPLVSHFLTPERAL